MRIAFLTDSHLRFDPTNEEFERIVETAELVIHGGDFNKFKPEEMHEKQVTEKDSQKAIEEIKEELCSKEFIYALGNHDVNSQIVQKIPLCKFDATFSKNAYILVISGSHSTMIKNETPLKSDLNFWEGYPYGPLIKDVDQEFISMSQEELLFIQSHNRVAQSRITEKQIDVGKEQYEQIQKLVNPNEEYILLTHQGPYESRTSLEFRLDSKFSSGSFGIQRAIEDFPEIRLVLHGHSHEPQEQEDCMGTCKIINPGSVENGNICVVSVDHDLNAEAEFSNIYDV